LCPRDCGFRQDYQEFLASITALYVAGAQHRVHAPAYHRKDGIATQVPVLVVDRLEVIQIEHQQAQMVLRAIRAPKLRVEHLQGVLTVIAARKPVPNAVVVDGTEQFGARSSLIAERMSDFMRHTMSQAESADQFSVSMSATSSANDAAVRRPCTAMLLLVWG
jgi:hypothetical protein